MSVEKRWQNLTLVFALTLVGSVALAETRELDAWQSKNLPHSWPHIPNFSKPPPRKHQSREEFEALVKAWTGGSLRNEYVNDNWTQDAENIIKEHHEWLARVNEASNKLVEEDSTQHPIARWAMGQWKSLRLLARRLENTRGP